MEKHFICSHVYLRLLLSFLFNFVNVNTFHICQSYLIHKLSLGLTLMTNADIQEDFSVKRFGIDKPRCNVIDKSDLLTPFNDAWELQKELLEQRLSSRNDIDDCVLLVQHNPVYTLGTGSTLDNVKFSLDSTQYDIFRVERGGEVTFHGPGQIVMYPILNLRNYKQDIHWYIRALEEVAIRALKKVDIPAYRIKGLTGVWFNNVKLCAIGVKIRRWYTMHGLALNVNPDLLYFENIVPCGISTHSVGSVAQYRLSVSVAEMRVALLEAFAEVFDVTLV